MPARRAAREVDPPGYPRDLIRTVLVDWGTTLRIRPIRPDDEAGLRAFFTRLSTRTVFQRFFRAWRQLPDEWYPRFVQVDYALGPRFGAGAFWVVYSVANDHPPSAVLDILQVQAQCLTGSQASLQHQEQHSSVSPATE